MLILGSLWGTNAQANPTVSESPSSLSFGSVSVNALSAPQRFTVMNMGSHQITIESVASSSSQFVVTGPSLPLTVNLGQGASFQVVFEPTTVGTFSGTINVSLNRYSREVKSVAVSGTGLATADPAATLKSIAVTPASPSIRSSQTQQFTATGTYSDSSTKNITTSVTWASSNTGVATIGSSTGLAMGVTAGTAKITATLGSVVSPSDSLTVTAATLKSIAVTPSNPSISPSQTQQFTATGTYSDGSTKNITTSVTWASSNTAVATIGTSSGLATSVTAGTSQITATLGTVVSPSDSLTVTAITLQSIAVTPSSPSISPSQTQQFTATGTYSDGSTKNISTSVTWASSNTAVATIGASTGLATGVTAGTSLITATLGIVVSPSDSLTVTAITLQSIAVTPSNPSISPSQTQQFTATGTYSDGSTKNISTSVTWASSNTAVATIGASTGLATGVTAGTSLISATLGSVVSPSDSLTVTATSGNSYTTNFPLTENPISEGGKWINGKVSGLDWANVRTTPGFAFGTETDTVDYDDSTAILAGTWGANQMAQAQIHVVSQSSNIFEEVEIRLRTSISAHSITGYEINCSVVPSNPYNQIVRWNGPLGSFTQLTGSSTGCADGDVLEATIVGSTITAYKNGVQLSQYTDSTFSSGSPGMGFYIQGGSASQESNYGFSNFTASDGSTPDTIPPSTPTNLAANVASLSEIDLSWSASTDNVAVVGYQIFRNTTKIATTASPSFADKTVIPGVQYTYAVTAFDAAGNISAQSSPVVAETSSVPDTTPPSVPTNLQSSNVTSSSLTVTWSASTDNVGVAGYQIFRNGAEVGATSTTSYADTGLVASTTYVYTVAAYDASGNVSTQSQQLTVTTAAAALMTPSFIQVNNNEIASGTKTSVVFNASTQAGNTIVVYVIWDNAGSVALTDSNGNAFVNVGGPLSWGSGYSAQIFYATNIVGGTDTVTAAFRTSVTSFGVIYVHEYAGINTLNPVDVTASASGSSTALNSGTATTTSANDLIFGAGVSDNMVTAAGSGFISRDMAYGNITEDRIAEAIGSYAATATHNGKMWGMQMVAFRAAQ
jgi:chitodextrinase